MTLFSCSGITKSFNDKRLFENIAFGMESGDKVGIIGKNGIGKTTLMKIIAGIEMTDSGEVVFNSKVKYEYLEQMPIFNSDDTALDYVMAANPELMEYEYKKILSQLGIEEFYKKINHLSGGLKKRVALAKALLSNPDLLILDEPTNHLDADTIQWLQDRLQGATTSLLFVTHDRYFLDAVANKILEIDQEKIFTYPGSFEQYLEIKEAFLKSQEATKIHTLSRLRVELAWLQRGARARRSKQKSRIDWVQELAKSIKKTEDKKIKIELGNKFLGSRIIEAHNISKSLGGKLLFQDVTYIAKPKDRIGIIGPNGSGKSTFLSVLAGINFPNKGRCEIGASANIGYFHQEIKNLKSTQSVIGALREIAEYIDVGIGRDRFITTRDLLDKFAFPRYQHTSLISTLSGGELRRLALCRLLMANPNVLLLDEPTNDFDLQTLSALEEYLDDFLGVLLIVSHDRAFLDRTVNFIWAFDGLGNIKEYPGNYSNYLEHKEKEKRINKTEYTNKPIKQSSNTPKTKLSYMEQRELDALEKNIPELESKKAEIKLAMQVIEPSEYKQIEELSIAFQKITDEIDTATERWLELSSFSIN